MAPILRALHPFCKTHPTSISFQPDDLFIQLPDEAHNLAADANWLYVICLRGSCAGSAGFIPRTYVSKADDVDEDEALQLVHQVRARVRMGTGLQPREKADLLAKLDAIRVSSGHKEPMSSAQSQPEATCEHSRELLLKVRDATGLSHAACIGVVKLVLSFVADRFEQMPEQGTVQRLLREVERHQDQQGATLSREQMASCSDAAVMEQLLEDLTRHKEDEQQRNWMLHQDEAIIADLLTNLINCMQNAEPQVSVYVLSKFKYWHVHSLVEYFQMESRWPLRQTLIELFMLMCSLDSAIISLMLASVLPLELAQEIHTASASESAMSSVVRLRHCALLLTAIFSQGEPMPVHYAAQLGPDFIDLLFHSIESPPSPDFEADVADVFIGLLLSYNLQFKQALSNVTIQCLSRQGSCKTFLEQLLLLLNREEDPTDVVRRSSGSGTNATHKMLMNIFEDPVCSQLFYTNDLFVLIDIIVRQLNDLNTDDPKRIWYLTLCRLVLSSTNYCDHLHRFGDLQSCFSRVLSEDHSDECKAIVRQTCESVPAFRSTLACDIVN